MKKVLIVLLALIMCLSFTACNNIKPKDGDEDLYTATVVNPVNEYSSLKDINDKIGVNLLKPENVEVSNEKFSIIDDDIAQYTCEIDGRKWTFRAGYITDEDISGMYNEYNTYTPYEDYGLYTNDFYLDRFFDGERQYTIVVTPAEGLDSEVFSDICMSLKFIQKSHFDDPMVGHYQCTTNENIITYVERFGDVYNISVNLTEGYDFSCWTMYDAVKEGDKLTYRGEEIGKYVYDDEWNEISSNVTMANNVGYVEFKDGLMYWPGAAQEQCRAWVFEKIIYDEE